MKSARSLLVALVVIGVSRTAVADDVGDPPKDPPKQEGLEVGAAGVVYGMPLPTRVGFSTLAYFGGGLRVTFPIARGRARIGILGEGFCSLEGVCGGAAGVELGFIKRFGIVGLGAGVESHILAMKRNTNDGLMTFLLLGGQGVFQLDFARTNDAVFAIDVRPRIDLYWLGLMYGATAGLSVRFPE